MLTTSVCRHYYKRFENCKPLHPHWNSLLMSTLHHQPLWLSLRNTNQQSALNSLALSLFFLCYLTLSFSLSFSVCSLLLTENKCCITILILAWASRFCLVFFFFCLLEMHGASSGGAAQSKGSGVWILMTSTRRKWEEDVWGESFLNLLFSPSACLSLTYGPALTARVCLWDLSPFDFD